MDYFGPIFPARFCFEANYLKTRKILWRIFPLIVYLFSPLLAWKFINPPPFCDNRQNFFACQPAKRRFFQTLSMRVERIPPHSCGHCYTFL